jgi:hypothetical protein
MAGKKNALNRRDFLKGVGMGVIGSFALGGEIACLNTRRTDESDQPASAVQLYKKVTEPARVSLVKGSDRREIVFQSLKAIEDEVLGSLSVKKRSCSSRMSWFPTIRLPSHIRTRYEPF